MDYIKGKDGREQIAALLDKYMDGETSNAEEARLRQYFATAGNDMPDEWRAYRALFRYEAEERANNAGAEEDMTAKKHARHKAKARGPWIRGMAIMSAAASVAALIILFLSLPRGEKNYAVIDGKKYTNQKVVMQEAEEALSLVSSNEEDTFDALGQIQ